MNDERKCFHIKKDLGTSLVVQWLRLRPSNAGDPGLIPGQGTRSHMPQLRVRMWQLKDPACRNYRFCAATKVPHAATKISYATTKTRLSQTNKQTNK